MISTFNDLTFKLKVSFETSDSVEFLQPVVLAESTLTLDELNKAYNEKVDVVLVNEKVNFLLPLVCVLTKQSIDIIKPTIPVYYYLKDNKIIQKVKTTCHKKMTTFTQIKTRQEVIDLINDNI